VADALFAPDGEGFAATELTRGPWDPGSQHAGPPSALLARAVERAGRLEGRVARITVEILRPVPIGRLEVRAEVVRPGRRVELVEAALADEQGDLMLARAWRIRTQAVELSPPPPAPDRVPGPEQAGREEFFPTGADTGFHTANELRFAHGAWREPGPARAWVRLLVPLVQGEQPSPLARVLAAADFGNGISAALDFARFVFINADLSVALLREPVTDWVCLDSITYPLGDGIGLTDTALFDEQGRIGRATQSLLVAPRPDA